MDELADKVNDSVQKKYGGRLTRLNSTLYSSEGPVRGKFTVELNSEGRSMVGVPGQYLKMEIWGRSGCCGRAPVSLLPLAYRRPSVAQGVSSSMSKAIPMPTSPTTARVSAPTTPGKSTRRISLAWWCSAE